MGDLIFLIIVLAFFSLTVVFVKACDSIIGPDPDVVSAEDTPEPNLIVVVDGVQVAEADASGVAR